MTMPASNDRIGWSALHEMALIYMALLHGTESDRTANRTETVGELLRSWYPEVDDRRLRRVLRDTLLTYIGPAGDQMLATSVVSLRRSMPRDQRIAVLSDLADIAMHRGFVVPDEASFIERLAQEWDIERDVQ